MISVKKSKLFFTNMAFCVTVIIIAILFSDDRLAEWSLYSRVGVENGEYWRIISAHFAHLNFNHLVLNLASWVLVWLYGFPVCNAKKWLWFTLFTTITCGWSIHILEPHVFWHGGLSGILHGLFLAIVLLRIHADAGDWGPYIGLVVFGGKLVWESFYGALSGTQELIGGPVLTEIHLHGAISGLFATILLFMKMHWNKKQHARKTEGGG